MTLKRAAALFLLGSGMACTTTPPIQEYTLARTAIESARKIEAVRVAPAFFHKAEEAYRKAEAEYKREEFGIAKDLFITARDYAERAENAARLQKND
jgi:hypothetical protein